MEIHQRGVMDTLIREFEWSESVDGFNFGPKHIPSSSGPKSPDGDPESSLNSTRSVEYPRICMGSGVDSPDTPLDAGLRFISEMLMEEEDLEHKPCMFQDCLALQAAEKSLYEIIGEKYPPTLEYGKYPSGVCRDFDSPDGNFMTRNDNSGNVFEPWFCGVDEFESPFVTPSEICNSGFESGGDLNLAWPFFHRDEVIVTPGENERDNSPSGSGGKRNHHADNTDYIDSGRINKQLPANYVEESDEQTLIYDTLLLCPEMNPHLHQSPDNDPTKNGAKVQVKRSNGGRPRKNQGNEKEVVDFSTLLTQCAQAVASNNGRTVNQLLKRIRQHSSPHGDGSERLAHYLANALERRLAGDGTGASFVTSGISAREVLKGCQAYMRASPFKIASYYYANQMIVKLSRRSTRLHIIDFGILYGYQWPCLIQLLSMAPGGPPKLRITGIDLPQSGLRPAERVEETGRRLKNYCDRFNVPFKYTAIAKKWDSVQLEDIEFEKDELLVVNCLYRFRNVPDESVMASNPRDTVLNLIRRINPDLFVHGIVNGTYNTPFFLTRFRETFFFYSTFFDMFDATINREDENRMLYEREVFAKDIMNVIACEGTERVERPETYKQWQVRNMRAGFRQVALHNEIIAELRDMLRRGYHPDFMIDLDGKWMLQGWKGRVISAISCWKPNREMY